jgi:hydroxymethylpyrimidine pyrophosphatase-like HAD family hydrolase
VADAASRLPRLVATDLDGTLVRSDGTVSDRTRDVLAAVEARGVPVVFVTARPLRWMDEVWPMVGDHGLAVVSNGGIVFDVAAREVRELHGIGPEQGLILAAAIYDGVPGASIAIETVTGIRMDPTYTDDAHVTPPGSPVGPLEDVWTDPAVKVLVRHAGMEPGALRDAVVTAVGELATPTWTLDGLMEISAPGVTKASALVGLAAELGVAASDVLAFGDMPNDLPMLTWAGTSYAMDNAHPDVVAAAGDRAPSNDEDGVAVVLERVFGLGPGNPRRASDVEA